MNITSEIGHDGVHTYHCRDGHAVLYIDITSKIGYSASEVQNL